MNKKKSKKQKQNYSIGIYISRVQSKDTNEKPRFEFYDRKAQTKKNEKQKQHNIKWKCERVCVFYAPLTQLLRTVLQLQQNIFLSST